MPIRLQCTHCRQKKIKLVYQAACSARLLIKEDARERFPNVQHAALGLVNASITGKIQSHNLTRNVPCMSLQRVLRVDLCLTALHAIEMSQPN